MSRYAVDGGVLANTPTQAALRAIDRRGAAGPCRRAMLLVYPHAPGVDDVPADRADEPPTTLAGLSAVLGALQSQGSRTYVERIEEHNRVAADWRGGRHQVLTTVGRDVDSLFDLARVAWPHYVDVRIRRAALDLAERVPQLGVRARQPFEHVREQAEAAQGDVEPTPYVPANPPPDPAALAGPGWRWGFTTALGVADAVAEVLRTASRTGTPQECDQLAPAIEQVTALRLRILDARERTDADWVEDPFLRGLEPDRAYWTARLRAYRRAMLGTSPDDDQITDYLVRQGAPPDGETVERLVARDGGQGRATRAAVLGIVGELVRALPTVLALADSGRSPALATWRPLLELHGGHAARTRELTQRLLALDVAVWLVADGPATGTSLPIRLVQLSLQTEHDWASRSTSPDDKAAGMGLARFGGFLKRSWRMNDWFWGRLDAVVVLHRTVLDPGRLARVAEALGGRVEGVEDLPRLQALADAEFETLSKALIAEEPEPAQMQRLRDAARDELREVFCGDARRTHLPALSSYAAFPLQARIALEELPVVAAAIRQDRVEGASPRSRGERFLEGEQDLLRAVAAHAPESPGWLALGARALAAFDAAGIGREDLVEEAGSDALVRTSTKAAGAFATLLDSSRLGASALKPVGRTVRGAALLPYWILTGLAGGAPLARFLATVGLVGGGVLLALGLFGVLGWAGPVGGTVGAATLMAALGYSALRSGSLLHGVALLGPVLPLAAYAFSRSPGSDAGESAGGLLALVVLVAGLYVLGRIPWPLGSPRATLHTPGFRRSVGALVLGVVGALLAAAAWVGAAFAWRAWGHWSIALAATVVAVIAGAYLAHKSSVGLRRWRPAAAADELADVAPNAIRGPFLWEPVADPDGVAASWAAVYGTAYLGCAWALGSLAEPRGGIDPRTWNWVSTAVAAWAVLGVVLLLVAPWMLSRRAWVRGGRTVARAGALESADPDRQLLRRLVALDVASWHFCESVTGGPGAARAPTTAALRLTRAGRRLSRRLTPDLPTPAE